MVLAVLRMICATLGILGGSICMVIGVGLFLVDSLAYGMLARPPTAPPPWHAVWLLGGLLAVVSGYGLVLWMDYAMERTPTIGEQE